MAKRTPRMIPPNGVAELPFIGRLLASAGETDGAFELIDYTGPATPPPHVHREHDEAFYVLKGKFQFLLGYENTDAPQGSLVFVPRGTRHGFTVETGSRALLLTVPAGLVGFFRELGTGLSEGRSSAEIRTKLAGKYDSYPELT